MTQDPLSDVLCSVRLRGAVFYYVSCSEPWAVESPPACRIADAVMPGADHVVAYHLVAKGNAWVEMAGSPPAPLTTGDIIMFPRGDAHYLSSAPGLRATAGDDHWVYATRNDPKPIPIANDRGVLYPHSELSADEAQAIIVCGFIGCDMRPFNPLIESLPRLLHLAANQVGAWVVPVLHQAVSESRSRRPGSAAVLERVSEMVFVDAARRYLETMPDNAGGWLAALRDRHVSRAITLMHARPAEPWTIDELGKQVGLSRSALHERFIELVGQPPMQYLTSWRMQRGAQLLREGRATVATIAQEVGYDSEAAFARAFKRLAGLPPAAWRRGQRFTSPSLDN